MIKNNTKYVSKKSSNNLIDLVYNTLREELISNKIKAGDYLSENEIAKQLNISRTPVREALRILASQDIVEIRNGLGVQVKIIPYSDIIDMYEVRKSMEKLAAKTAIRIITNEEIALLESHTHELAESESSDLKLMFNEFYAIDNRVHGLLIDKCSNSYVKKIMKTIELRVTICQHLSMQTLDSIKESSIQHLNMLKWIKEKDIQNLEKSIDEHIDWSLANLLRK